ncbi:MAG: amidohydrolase family protein, partial [Terriglobus roseus]|nr:amidohydrolase family protein [Terriglobus roseus]
MAPTGWLDVHGHFFMPDQLEPANWERFMRAFVKSDNFLVPEGYRWTLDDTLQDMDRNGVQMQILSYLPLDIPKLRQANDYAASIVKGNPTRFGYFAALPTEDPRACLDEIDRVLKEGADVQPDGFAVTACRKGIYFSDPSLLPVWEKLESLGAVVFMHPMAYGAPKDGRPLPVIEVAFETARVATDMVYRKLPIKFPNVKVILAHSGGALPALSGRLQLLGTEPWVPNEEGVTAEEMGRQLASFYVDTAATAETGLQPAVKMCGPEHVIYGADCGVP